VLLAVDVPPCFDRNCTHIRLITLGRKSVACYFDFRSQLFRCQTRRRVCAGEVGRIRVDTMIRKLFMTDPFAAKASWASRAIFTDENAS